jgi:uncharacterized membrane protein
MQCPSITHSILITCVKIVTSMSNELEYAPHRQLSQYARLIALLAICLITVIGLERVHAHRNEY